MIFGFNTDVPANGKTYHVQTEDRGARNPVVDSIIYLGGKIVDRVRTPYDAAKSTQEQIETLVRNQHRELVESIRDGSFKPPVAGSPTEGSSHGGYGIRLLNPAEIENDGQFSFEIAVWNRTNPGPGYDVDLDVRWLSVNHDVQRYQGKTEKDGRALFSFPASEQGDDTALLICATGSEGRSIVKYRVYQSPTPSPIA